MTAQRRFLTRLIVLSMAASALIPAALAAPSPTIACPTTIAAGPTFLSLGELDPRIVAALQEYFAQGQPFDIAALIAPRDADWQATDVLGPGPAPPGRRFIQGGRIGDRWYVWYESGGIAHMFHTAVFELPPGADYALIRAHWAGRLDELCQATATRLAPHGPAP